MNSSETIEQAAQAKSVKVTDDDLIVELVDGRKISVPISWYPRLLHGSGCERREFELIGQGTGIHWPMLDEDISVTGILKGQRSWESADSLARWMAARS